MGTRRFSVRKPCDLVANRNGNEKEGHYSPAACTRQINSFPAELSNSKFTERDKYLAGQDHQKRCARELALVQK